MTPAATMVRRVVPVFASILWWIILASTRHDIHAFPTGAGACPHSRPAVGGAHLSAKQVVNGTLEDGDVELTLDDDLMSPDRSIFLRISHRTPLRLRASYSGSGITGFLIRLGRSECSSVGTKTGDLDWTDALSLPSNDTATRSKAKVEETFCPEQNAAGITHNDSEPKYLVKGELFFYEPMADLILDITVVVQNSVNGSEFYYSQYTLQVVDENEKVDPPSLASQGTEVYEIGESSSGTLAATVAATGLTAWILFIVAWM